MSVDRIRRWLLGLVLAFAVPAGHAQTVGSAFTYQGELRAAGAPANAAYDFQFRLFSSASGTTQVGPTLTLAGVSVINGLFSVPLDFGPAQFAGDAQWLEISVRPATGGAFETLVPRTAVTATPYALGAVAALANSVTGTSIVDGSVQAGDLAAGAVGTTQVNATQVQRRVTGSCTGSQGVQSIGQDGTVVCGSFGTGTITGVTAGPGLTGGGTSGSVALGIAAGGVGSAQINPDQVQARVASSCPSGQSIRAVNADGTVVCAAIALSCTGTNVATNTVPAGAEVFFSNPACPAGSKAVTPYCWTDSPEVYAKGSGFNSNNPLLPTFCAWRNTGSASGTVFGGNVCCRVDEG